MIMANSSKAINKTAAGVKVFFCGVGEAFDENLANTSILIKFFCKGEFRFILLDCGFTAAPAFWKVAPAPVELDGIWISHLHGDHFLGLPQLLIRFSEHAREKKLYISGVKGIEEAVVSAMELAYPGKIYKLPFKIIFSEPELYRSFELSGIPARTFDIDHPVPCIGVRFDFEGKSLFYTGDGKVPDLARKIVRGCDLGIFETYTLSAQKHGHNSVTEAAAFARSAGIKYLAAVHMNRDERQTKGHLVIEKLKQAGVQGFLPGPGDVVEL